MATGSYSHDKDNSTENGEKQCDASTCVSHQFRRLASERWRSRVTHSVYRDRSVEGILTVTVRNSMAKSTKEAGAGKQGCG